MFDLFSWFPVSAQTSLGWPEEKLGDIPISDEIPISDDPVLTISEKARSRLPGDHLAAAEAHG